MLFFVCHERTSDGAGTNEVKAWKRRPRTRGVSTPRCSLEANAGDAAAPACEKGEARAEARAEVKMGKTIVLHPLTITLKPYPTWDRLRIALEVLIFGNVKFSGQITALDGLPQHPALRRD